MPRLFPLALGALLLSGCTTVGPDYAAPAPAVQDAWIEPAETGAIDPQWWTRFGDPVLSALMTRAMTDAPTVAQARARLAEARANRDAVLGGRLPTVTAQGAATENRLSENGTLPVSQIPGFSPEYSLFDLGFDASWEVDLWGRRTREAEAATAQIGAAQAGLDQTLVQLTAEIARAYIDLRASQQNAATASAAAKATGEIARLSRMRYDAGESSRSEALTAEAEASAAADALAQAEAAQNGAAFRIAALMGVPPESIVAELQPQGAIPDAPERILVGLRSDLLRRRPDVRVAERNLAAATANVGLATADLFPRFSLMGGLGTQARDAGDLFDPASTRFSIGPSFSWPIFSGGRIRAQIRAADARADGAAAAYDQAVAEALADSEGAINRFLAAKRREYAATQALAAQESALSLAQARYRQGEDNRLQAEQARLELLARQRAHVTARAETASAAVALYKALGGGWQAPAPDGEDPEE